MNTILDHPPRAKLLTGVRALAVGVTLVVIAYGIARPPESSFLSTSEARAAAQAQTRATAAWSQDEAVPPMPAATSRFHAAESSERSQSSAAPRECEPERGDTDGCVFN